jgi:3-oxoadipate enol-lactonase
MNVLKSSMSKLTNAEIKRIDKFVIINADDATQLIKDLKVPAIALKGKEDYVPHPPSIKTTIVKGGHISPIESPDEVTTFCKRLF